MLTSTFKFIKVQLVLISVLQSHALSISSPNNSSKNQDINTILADQNLRIAEFEGSGGRGVQTLVDIQPGQYRELVDMFYAFDKFDCAL